MRQDHGDLLRSSSPITYQRAVSENGNSPIFVPILRQGIPTRGESREWKVSLSNFDLSSCLHLRHPYAFPTNVKTIKFIRRERSCAVPPAGTFIIRVEFRFIELFAGSAHALASPFGRGARRAERVKCTLVTRYAFRFVTQFNRFAQIKAFSLRRRCPKGGCGVR